MLLQLRVGGQDARHGDETGRTRCGCIGQETTGPGGFAKALRTVPVVLGVAEAVRRHAKPDAWIIDFTNPVGIVDPRALLEAGHRAVGLCNVAIGFQRRFAAMLDVDADRGCSSVTSASTTSPGSAASSVDGARRLPGLLATRLERTRRRGRAARLAAEHARRRAELLQVGWYQKAAAADNSWGKPLYRLGTLAMNKGDKDAALKAMSQVLAVDPTSPEAAQARATIEQLKK